MAILHLTRNSATLKKTRRALKASNLTMRVWAGRIIVSGWPSYKDPKSEKQLACRRRFQEANVLVMADFCRLGSSKYWTQRAKKERYKTAKGCARAHYYNELKQRDAASEKGLVYIVELVPLEEVAKKAKVTAGNVRWFNADFARQKAERLKPRLDAISEFVWDYQVVVDSPPK
jgi:hypothetical protein